MNQILKSNILNRNFVYQNIKCQIDAKKNIFRQLKEYYKNKSNLYNYLKDNNCNQFLENFELLNYINSGGSGVVYKGCIRNNPSDEICLKFLLNKTEMENLLKPNNNINNIPNVKNINKDSKIEEINIQKKLQHKNIIKYYDYFDLRDYGCIVMELAESGDIDMIRKKMTDKTYLSETFLAFITKQILDGLYYIHKNKIIHMDIKQPNILIDKNLEIKIIDFSISLSYEKIKSHEKIKLPLAGTNPFMSPEVLSKAQIDIEDASKIDMFSLGVMLFNLSIGDFPYNLNVNHKKNYDEIFEKIKNNELEFPENKVKSRRYSNLFLKFLKNLLDKNIKNRISVFDALDDPWIKGTKLIFEEKEKIGDNPKFLLKMTCDNIRSFNEYLKMWDSETFNTSN